MDKGERKTKFLTLPIIHFPLSVICVAQNPTVFQDYLPLRSLRKVWVVCN